MFLLGLLAQRHRAALAPWFEGRAAAWLLAYLLLSLALKITAGVEPGGNNPNPFNMLALAGLTLSAAQTVPMLSNRLLRGNDVSYGVYIYHMVIVNILWELGFGGSPKGLLLATAHLRHRLRLLAGRRTAGAEHEIPRCTWSSTECRPLIAMRSEAFAPAVPKRRVPTRLRMPPCDDACGRPPREPA